MLGQLWQEGGLRECVRSRVKRPTHQKVPCSFLRFMSRFSWQREHQGQHSTEMKSPMMEPCREGPVVQPAPTRGDVALCIPIAPGQKREPSTHARTDRDVVSGTVQGPHGHTGPAEAALVHVPGHLAAQAEVAEGSADAYKRHTDTPRSTPVPRPPRPSSSLPRAYSQTPQSEQQSISPVCHSLLCGAAAEPQG